MTELKWTPGPWRFDPRGHIEGAGRITIARVVALRSDESSYNAHLIAAAPDLYAALIKMNGLVEDAQGILSMHLEPDGPSIQDAMGMLIELFDNGEQGAIQSAARAAMTTARGETT